MRVCITPYADELYHYNKNHDAKGRFASGPGGSYGGMTKRQYKKEMKLRAKMAKEAYKQDKLETKAAKASGNKEAYYKEKAQDQKAKQNYQEAKNDAKKDSFDGYTPISKYMNDGKRQVDNVINKYSDDNYVAKAQKDLKKWKNKDTQYIWDKANRENAENSYLGAREKRAQYSGARRTGTRATQVILTAGTIAAGVYFGKKVLDTMKGGS